MKEFQLNDFVEVGIGESIHDTDGYSVYFKMDVEGITEADVYEAFEDRGNILYVKVSNDTVSRNFAGDETYSNIINPNSKEVDINLIVELPKDYIESSIDTAIADAIYGYEGKIIDSKEFVDVTDEFENSKHKEDNRVVKISITTKLPNDFIESEVDDFIAEAIFKKGGQLIDSKEFVIL
jgi:hypothetical protein